VDTQTRHALKQDKFVQATTTGLDWVQENRAAVIRISVAVVVLVVAVIVGAVVYANRSQAAEVAFGKAMDTYTTPLRQPGQPVDTNNPSFATAADRAHEANGQFLDVANHYGWLKAGKNARYLAGVTYLEMGQTASAETELKRVADSGDAGLAGLAKLALAGVYHQTGRDSQAADLLQKLIAKPTDTVPASAARLQLAEMYEASNPAEAKRIYAEIKDKDKTSPAAQIAAQKLAGTPPAR
jgi:predicted negative regulator of RcsB-dependent stress response